MITGTNLLKKILRNTKFDKYAKGCSCMWVPVNVCSFYSVAVRYLHLCLFFSPIFRSCCSVSCTLTSDGLTLRLSPIISRSTRWMTTQTRAKSRSNPDKLGSLSTSCKNSKTSISTMTDKSILCSELLVEDEWIVISLWLEWLLVFIWLICLLGTDW